MARSAASLIPEQLLSRGSIPTDSGSIVPRERAYEGDDAPDVLFFEVARESTHLGSRNAFRDDLIQIGVFVADRINAAREVRSPAAFSANAVAGRAVRPER